MKERIALTIIGTPMAVQSVRAVRFGKTIRRFQPKKVEDWKAYLRLAALEQLPDGWQLLDEALAVSYTLVFPVLKSMSQKVLKQIENGETVYKTTKPDVDNCLKGLNDSLSGVVWKDDALICKVMVKKVYGMTPKIEITVNGIG